MLRASTPPHTYVCVCNPAFQGIKALPLQLSGNGSVAMWIIRIPDSPSSRYRKGQPYKGRGRELMFLEHILGQVLARLTR